MPQTNREAKQYIGRMVLQPDPDDSDDPVPITDDTWIQALKTWSKHVSSEILKQVVVTLSSAPDVEGQPPEVSQ